MIYQATFSLAHLKNAQMKKPHNRNETRSNQVAWCFVFSAISSQQNRFQSQFLHTQIFTHEHFYHMKDDK